MISAYATCAELTAALNGFEICREPWSFYYDETNNPRIVRYKRSSALPLDALVHDFILGGLAITDDEAIAVLESEAAELPHGNGELKAKTVLGGSKDFLRVMSSDATSRYLRMLNKDGVFVHLHSQDNFYFAIVDIVDSILPDDGLVELSCFHKELKSALYIALSKDIVSFLDEAAALGFPNIDEASVPGFCDLVKKRVVAHVEGTPELKAPGSWYFGMLIDLLERASSHGCLALLNGNAESCLVDGFAVHYRDVCALFPESTHYFDMETFVAKEMPESLGSFMFVDSASSTMIQLSDVWVGLLSRLFQFLDEWASDPSLRSSVRISNTALSNFRLVRRLLVKSSRKHTALQSFLNPIITVSSRSLALCDLCQDLQSRRMNHACNDASFSLTNNV